VNDTQQVVGTLTDGDIRRGLISGSELSCFVNTIMHKEFKYILENEFDVTHLKLFRDKNILFIPILDDNQWDRVLSTNLDGFYNVLHPIVMPMVENRVRGRIITMSSVSGIIGNRGQVNYSAAKAGIIGATKALAVELAKHKITVNCIAPGLIDTDMLEDLPIEEVKKIIPARRLGKPEEVASLVNYLLSEEASYLTRQVISVNGGMI
jgi:3-oxoacyl-[acyl-carrier protein] reductase